MNYSVRPVCLDDCCALQTLCAEGLGYDYPLELLTEKVKALMNSGRDDIFVAANDENTVVGFIHIVDYDVIYADRFKNIMGIAVLPEYRRKGVGTALIEAAENEAKKSGAAGIRLNSGETRIGAHCFYRSLGYTSDKKQLNFKKYLCGE